MSTVQAQNDQESPSLQDSELPGFFIKTFGCQMNEYDSEKVLDMMRNSHRRVSKLEEAEVVFVNTCSVREKGEQKLRSILGTLRDIKKFKPEMIIGVGGCVAQQEGVNIIKHNPAVDFVVGTHNLSLVPALVDKAKSGAKRQVAVDYREDWEELSTDFYPLTSQPFPVRALIAIQRGCNKNCAYCVVPKTRGAEISRSPDEIEREVRLKIRQGAKEVLLLGQTVNSYGRDLDPRYPFEKLIRRLAQLEGLKRIRFTSPHPAEVKAEFIELYAEIPQLCPHIHLPLQSGSDRILKLMNRNYRTSRYLEIVDSLRLKVPSISITSDIIVGFPTETDDDFLKTLEVVKQVSYNSLYSFKYSRRPNTQALVAYAESDEIPDVVKQERLQVLQSTQEKISKKVNSQFVGKCVEVLIEQEVKGLSRTLRGRSAHNVLSDIDSGNAGIGELVKVDVITSSAFGLKGTIARA